jgi:hypothetical protein
MVHALLFSGADPMRPKSKAELTAEIKALQTRIHNLETGVAAQGTRRPPRIWTSRNSGLSWSIALT